MIDGRTLNIVRGNLWLDRQMVAAASDSSPAPRDAESLKQYLVQAKPAGKSLYLGGDTRSSSKWDSMDGGPRMRTMSEVLRVRRSSFIVHRSHG